MAKSVERNVAMSPDDWVNMVKDFFGSVPFPYRRELASPAKGSDMMEVTSIELRKPRGRDWRRWQDERDKAARNTRFIADLSDLDVSTIDDLDFEDHAVLMRIADGFFASYRPEDSGLMTSLTASALSTAGPHKP